MSGRPAPPGRKGSVKVNAFKADADSAIPVAATLTAAERQKHERDEEMKKLMAMRKQALTQESEAPEPKKDVDSSKSELKKVDSSVDDKKRREDVDKKRLEEIRARNAKLEEDEQAANAAKVASVNAEKAAAAKRATEEAEKAAAARRAAEETEKAAAAKRATEEAEKAAAARRAAEETDRANSLRKLAEEEENARAQAIESARLADVAAKEEILHKEKAEKAEKAKLLLLEQQKKEQEEAEQEELAFQQEQEQQRAQIELQRKKREEEESRRQLEQQEFLRQQEELEEKQRLMDEKLARQKVARAEAAANEKREQELQQKKLQEEAQERERVRQEQLAAHQAAEQAEIARLREEEAVRQQELIEAQRREEEEHAAEVERLESERAAAAEEARKAESAISEYENAALEEKKRRAEAQRKKREMFLSEMDSFSTSFEAKTQVEDQAIKAEQDAHYELLAQQMKQVEDAKAATQAKEAQEKEQRAAQLALAAEVAAAELAAANVPPPAPVPVVRATPPTEDAYSIHLHTSDEPKRNVLDDALFRPSSPKPSINPTSMPEEEEPFPAASPKASVPLDTIEEDEDQETAEITGASEELRVPTRIGSGKTKARPMTKPVAVSVINARTSAAVVKYSEDEEEEGTGEINSISNVLTLEERRKMTLAQKESWRAKQADLTDKRKDFHGVVTYTFDGVFSWQMYGSAEAVDDSGSNYTEYLMRCQWGTNFENMQPWIVAHRYKEFDQLDQALKKKFPRLEANMPKLPKKELFRSLHADVVSERRAILEEYMSKIVTSMPSLLRSELMNDFCDITNRISGIRLMLLKASNARVEAAHTPPPTPPATRPNSVAPLAAQPAAVKTTGVSSNSKYGIEDPLAFRSQAAPGTDLFSGDVEEEPLYWTMDDAEDARVAQQSRSLDEDQLGHLETDVRALGQLLRQGDAKTVTAKDSKFRLKFKSVSKRWPSLRATAVVGMGVDFTLIPRAMQAEEDLVRFVNAFRNIETVTGMAAGSRIANV